MNASPNQRALQTAQERFFAPARWVLSSSKPRSRLPWRIHILDTLAQSGKDERRIDTIPQIDVQVACGRHQERDLSRTTPAVVPVRLTPDEFSRKHPPDFIESA